jgi:hypothetical protein
LCFFQVIDDFSGSGLNFGTPLKNFNGNYSKPKANCQDLFN